MPDSINPWMAASECSGVLEMCDQSRSVVMPAFIAPHALSKSPMYTSSGRYRPRAVPPMESKYWASVPSGRMLRIGPCHTWRCESTKPGMTIRFEASISVAEAACRSGPIAAIFDPSISTSARSKSPSFGSMVRTTPPFSSMRSPGLPPRGIRPDVSDDCVSSHMRVLLLVVVALRLEPRHHAPGPLFEERHPPTFARARSNPDRACLGRSRVEHLAWPAPPTRRSFHPQAIEVRKRPGGTRLAYFGPETQTRRCHHAETAVRPRADGRHRSHERRRACSPQLLGPGIPSAGFLAG